MRTDRPFNLQGYEPQALVHLISLGIKPEDIEPGSIIDSVSYTQNGTLHYYHPDFYIKSKNTIVEVKSTWTFAGSIQKFEMTKAKAKACIRVGYNFKLLIMKSNTDTFYIPRNWSSYNFNEIKAYL